MTAASFLDYCIIVALVLLPISFALILYRIVRGPSLPDRIVGLDMLVTVGIAFIAVLGIKTGYSLYVDIAIALGLVGFLATVAFARFVLHRGEGDEPAEMVDSAETDAADGDAGDNEQVHQS